MTSWIAATCGVVSYYFWSHPQTSPSDFTQLWAGARVLLAGGNPYAAVGPGRAYEWNFPLLYPLPAVLAAVPFSLLPLRLADPLFVAAGAGALAWALTRERLDNPRLLLFASAAYLFALQTSQWSPLLTAAALQPTLGFLLACKPTLAIALLVAFPSRRSVLAAMVFFGGSILLFPWWPLEWLRQLPAAHHMAPQALSFRGALLLLALWRWREPKARLLVAMGCVPHTPLLYEALPLFLIPRTAVQASVLCALSVIVGVGARSQAPFATFDEWASASRAWIGWLLYLPCLAMVLFDRTPDRATASSREA